MSEETQVTLEEAPAAAAPAAPARSFWAAMAIVVIWLAVLFVGVFAEIHFELDTASAEMRVPVVWGIALLAFLATWVLARSAFTGD